LRLQNLLVGLLRGSGPPMYFLTGMGPLDVERFHADLAVQLGPADHHANRLDLSMHADAQAALEGAAAVAAQPRRGQRVTSSPPRAHRCY
jgi:hypothetical protein